MTFGRQIVTLQFHARVAALNSSDGGESAIGPHDYNASCPLARPSAYAPGEPYLQNDARGSFMVCLTCHARVDWKQDDDTRDLDFGSGAIA